MRFVTIDPFPFTSSPVPSVVILDDDAVPPKVGSLLPLDVGAREALGRAKAAYLKSLEHNRANLGLPPFTDAARAELLAAPAIAPEPASPARVFDLRRGGRGGGPQASTARVADAK